jgi:hypothetical protein
MKWIRFLLIGVLMSTVFRLQGLPDELRMEIEEASNGTITTEAARLIIERSVREAQTVFDTTLNNITKEVQGIVGPHGSITRMQAGGINISRGDGFSVYADGVIKTSIDPRGNVFIGSDLTQPSTTTELFFVEEYIYNGELFGAGDFLIGDNTSGQSNVKWDASEGQLQFRGGITTKAYMDTDGTLKAAGGGIVLDSSALKIVNLTDASDPFIIFYNSSGTALGQILTNSSGNLEFDAFGAAGAERKLVLRSLINAISAAATIEVIANSGNSGLDWITLNADRIGLTGYWDGWMNAPDTWTYASASTFTVPGDVTAIFRSGSKLAFVQTTQKYAVVASSSYSAPNTTVTIFVNTDYTIANAAITSAKISYAETPQGFPSWFNFTPAWTNLTVGNGTQTAKYNIAGKSIHFRIELTLGSTSSVGTSPTVNFPATAATMASYTPLGEATLHDAGTAVYRGFVFWSSTTVMAVNAIDTSGTYAAFSGVTSTAPFTWTTGDQILITGFYEAA